MVRYLQATPVRCPALTTRREPRKAQKLGYGASVSSAYLIARGFHKSQSATLEWLIRARTANSKFDCRGSLRRL